MLENFIRENIEKDIDNFETTDDLYDRYLKFCLFHNVEPISRRKFAYEIRKSNVGVKDGRQNIPRRWGVKLLPCKY